MFQTPNSNSSCRFEPQRVGRPLRSVSSPFSAAIQGGRQVKGAVPVRSPPCSRWCFAHTSVTCERRSLVQSLEFGLDGRLTERLTDEEILGPCPTPGLARRTTFPARNFLCVATRVPPQSPFGICARCACVSARIILVSLGDYSSGALIVIHRKLLKNRSRAHARRKSFSQSWSGPTFDLHHIQMHGSVDDNHMYI